MFEDKTGILLVNLGTPDSPAPRDVFRYLIEFLTDKRVMDIPWIKRQCLVRGVIVPGRYRQSAKSYQAIWTAEGSPLKVHGVSVKNKLQTALGNNFQVELAMRYRHPSIEDALKRFRKLNFKRILIVPLFPQYASATTGSVHQKVMEEVQSWINIPELIFIDQYADHPGLINAFCEVAKPYSIADYDHVLFSFHGLPERQLYRELGVNRRCYLTECHQTLNALVKALHLKEGEYSLTFQSRLGKEPWLKPFTNEVLHALAAKGCRSVLVFCPSFVSDCLETIYEIGIEYAGEFKKAGGDLLQLVPGLNEHPAWIAALKEIVFEHMPRSLKL